jgi:hypothetical protein
VDAFDLAGVDLVDEGAGEGVLHSEEDAYFFQFENSLGTTCKKLKGRALVHRQRGVPQRLKPRSNNDRYGTAGMAKDPGLKPALSCRFFVGLKPHAPSEKNKASTFSASSEAMPVSETEFV